MVFQAKLLADLAPRLHTLAEDLELNILAAACGARVAYAPDAVVFDPKPKEPKSASRQRARWLRGQLQVLRDYRRELFHSFVSGDPGTSHLLLMLILRPKTFFIAMRLSALALGLWQFALTGLAMDVTYYLALLPLLESRSQYLTDLIGAPRYAVMWLWSLNTAATRGDWSRSGR